MPSGPTRRSRRTRGERPEIVPSNSDEEREVDEEGHNPKPNAPGDHLNSNHDADSGSVVAQEAIRGKRRKRVTAAVVAGSGDRKKKTENTRRTRTRKKEEDAEKLKSGESSQEASGSDKSDDEDENNGMETGASGEENTSGREDKAGNDSQGKNGDETSDEDHDAEKFAVQDAPAKSKKVPKKLPSKKTSPSRRGRLRRDVTKPKTNETSGSEDDQAGSPPQSDGDDSSKVGERPKRRQTRKRKLHDHSAPTTGASDSSDEDVSAAAFEQKDKENASATADEKMPTTDSGNDSPSQRDGDTKDSEEVVDDEERDAAKSTELKTEDNDSEATPGRRELNANTTGSQETHTDGNKSSISPWLRKPTITSRRKDNGTEQGPSINGEAVEQRSSDLEGDKSDPVTFNEMDQSCTAVADEVVHESGEEKTEQAKEAATRETVEKLVEKGEQKPLGEKKEKVGDDLSSFSIEEEKARSNGAKRKQPASFRPIHDGDEGRDSVKQPQKRVKREKDDEESISIEIEAVEGAQTLLPQTGDSDGTGREAEGAMGPPELPSETIVQENEPVECNNNEDNNTQRAKSLEKLRGESDKPGRIDDPLPTRHEVELPGAKVGETPEVHFHPDVEKAHKVNVKQEESTRLVQDSEMRPTANSEMENGVMSESKEANEVDQKGSAANLDDENELGCRLHSARHDSAAFQQKAESSQSQEDVERGVDNNDEKKSANEILDHHHRNLGGYSNQSLMGPTIDKARGEILNSKTEGEVGAEVSDKDVAVKEATKTPVDTSEPKPSNTHRKEALHDAPPGSEINLTNVGMIDESSNRASMVPSLSKDPEVSRSGPSAEPKNYTAADEKNGSEEGAQPFAKQRGGPRQPSDCEEQESAPVSVNANEKPLDMDDVAGLKGKNHSCSLLSADKDPGAPVKSDDAEKIQRVPKAEESYSSDSMNIDFEAGRSSLVKAEDQYGDVEMTQNEAEKPTQDISSEFWVNTNIDVSTSTINPDDSRPTSDSEVESCLTRSVTAEIEETFVFPKTIVWKSLSTATPVQVRQVSTIYGLNENKVDRVKMVLYSVGSEVHRGRGFERLFADYWDAVCLRLSGRLSSHTSDLCDIAIESFLISKKLRKIHNQFIMGIMRRSKRAFARRSEISSYVPPKWRDRVKVRVIESAAVPKPRRVKSPTSLLEKSFLGIADVPHPVSGPPYKEPWQIFDDALDNSEIDLEVSTSFESASRCIPGAIVVDPLLRRAAEEEGLQSSNNATWLLTIAVREHTRNVLKGSIACKKALENGEVHPKFLQYPNILASNAKKDGKHHVDAPIPAAQEGNKKTRLSSFDIFSASRGLPAGLIGSLGGAISRTSLEQSLQSAFHSIPPFFPGKDFKEVQNFVANEIFNIAQTTEQALSPKRVDNASTASASLPLTSHCPGNPPNSSNKASPQAVPDSNEQKLDQSVNSIDDKQHDGLVNEMPPVQSSGTDQPNAVEETGQQQDQSEQQRPLAAAGRGAKSLRALMARASDTKKEDESVTRSSNNDVKSEESKEVRNHDNDKTSQAESQREKALAPETLSEDRDRTAFDVQGTEPKLEEKEDNPGEISQETWPQTQEASRQVEKRNDRESASAEESTEVTAPGMPKGKGFGTKNLAAMRAHSTTRSYSDGHKEGETKEE